MNRAVHGEDYGKKRDKLLIAGCILSFIGIAWAVVTVISQISQAIHYGLDEVFNLPTTFLIVLTFSVLFIPAVIFSLISLKRKKRIGQKMSLARISLIAAITGLTLALLQLIVYLLRLAGAFGNLLS